MVWSHCSSDKQVWVAVQSWWRANAITTFAEEKNYLGGAWWMRAHDGYSGRLFEEGVGEYRARLRAASYPALVVPCAGRGGQSAGAGRSSWNYLSRYLFSHSCSRLRGVGLRQSQGVSWAPGWPSRDFLAGAVKDVGGTVRVDSAYRWGGKVTSRLHNTHVCFNLFCLHGDPNLSRSRWEPIWLL